MAVVKKVFKEEGILIVKEFIGGSEEKEYTENGVKKVIPAQPDRYIVKIVSSEDIEDGLGMITPSYAEYTLNSGAEFVSNKNVKIATNEDIEMFSKLKYLDKVYVKLEMSTSGTFKIIGVVPANKVNKN